MTACYVAAGATFTSTAALSLGQGSALYGACAVPPTPGNPAIPAGTFNNSGTVTAAGSNTYPASIGYPYNSSCMVTNDTGTINIASGTLNLGGANVALNPGAHITGVSSSTLNVGGGEVDLNSGASISGPSTVDVEGVLSLVPSLSVPTLALNGILQGGGNVTVTAALSGGGQYNGTATVTVAPGATLTSRSLQVNSGSLVSNGTASIPLNDSLYVGAGATFTSTAALSLGQGSVLYGECAVPPSPGNPGLPAGVFSNSGTVTAAGSNTYPATIGYPNSSCMVTNDTGTINIASGTLNLGGSDVALNSGAQITGVSSSTLVVGGGGEVDLNNGASISGPSTVDEEGVLSLVPALSVPTLVLNGIVQGGGNVSVTAALSGGGQYSGTGTMTVAPGATLTSRSLQVNSGSLVSNGTASIPLNDSLLCGGGGDVYQHRGAEPGAGQCAVRRLRGAADAGKPGDPGRHVQQLRDGDRRRVQHLSGVDRLPVQLLLHGHQRHRHDQHRLGHPEPGREQRRAEPRGAHHRRLFVDAERRRRGGGPEQRCVDQRAVHGRRGGGAVAGARAVGADPGAERDRAGRRERHGHGRAVRDRAVQRDRHGDGDLRGDPDERIAAGEQRVAGEQRERFDPGE